eukprot:265975_1
MSNKDSNTIQHVLNKNHKQLQTQIDRFSINLHQHQQQLKSIIQSINQLVTFLQDRPIEPNNNQNITDELSQFSNNLQTKLELIAQCINNIESDQLQHLKDEILNALRDTNIILSNKIDDKHKSLSIINATDLKQQSKTIINSIQNIIQNNQSQKHKIHNQKKEKEHLDTLKQINMKLSEIDLQTKVLNEEIQHIQNQNKLSETNESESLHFIISNSEENILNKITNILPDIFQNVLSNYFHNQSNNNLNIDIIENKLSHISEKLSKMSIASNKEQPNNQLNTLFQQLQYIEQIGKENDKNNLIILNKLQNKYQTIQTQLENVEQLLSQILSSSSFQTTNHSKQSVNNSDILTTNVFLNRINAMEQRFESKLQKMSQQQTQFQKCVLEQLNQLISSNNVNTLSSIQTEPYKHSQNTYVNKPPQQNNMSLWMTVQNIDHNTNELNRKVKLLKEQQIAQFESITNTLCKQKETVSFQANNVSKYIQPNKPIVHTKSFLQQYSPYSRSTGNSESIHNSPIRLSINRKYNKDINSTKPSMSSDSDAVRSNCNEEMIMDCDDLVTWSNMDIKEKQLYCQRLMTRLFATELYEHTVEPRNSFYLKYAKKIIEDWKVKKLWNDENWELMDEKKLLISKMWSFMLMNWNECIPQG